LSPSATWENAGVDADKNEVRRQATSKAIEYLTAAFAEPSSVEFSGERLHDMILEEGSRKALADLVIGLQIITVDLLVAIENSTGKAAADVLKELALNYQQLFS
jgi:hypothetical protein